MGAVFFRDAVAAGVALSAAQPVATAAEGEAVRGDDRSGGGPDGGPPDDDPGRGPALDRPDQSGAPRHADSAPAVVAGAAGGDASPRIRAAVDASPRAHHYHAQPARTKGRRRADRPGDRWPRTAI